MFAPVISTLDGIYCNFPDDISVEETTTNILKKSQKAHAISKNACNYHQKYPPSKLTTTPYPKMQLEERDLKTSGRKLGKTLKNLPVVPINY